MHPYIVGDPFNDTGVVKTAISNTNEVAYSVAIQNDGKIIAAGYSWSRSTEGNDFAVVRYNTDGSLDESFNGGIVITNVSGNGNDVIRDVAIHNNGKIIAVGYSEIATVDHFAMAVYLP